MSVCITTNYLDPRSVYPVIDPRRTGGPNEYGYAFALDFVRIDVKRSGVSNCSMTVRFVSTLSEGKEIQAWNLFSNNFVDHIGSASLGLQSTMTITRASASTTPCGVGADTVILCRYYAWPRGRTALYTFPPDDFWDFWGGCLVTFNWISDTQGSGLWGNQTSQPTYPLLVRGDGMLLQDSQGAFSVVFGGAEFVVTDPTYLTAMGFNTSNAIAVGTVGTGTMPPFPVDGTLLREFGRPEVYVVFGGAKFWIPDPPTLVTLGFDWSKVRVIPPGTSKLLATMPIDGTLVKEQHNPQVFLVEGKQLLWVTSPTVMARRCLSWRNVRTVPDKALTSGLPHGSDLLF